MLVHCPKSLRFQHWQLTKDRANATKEDRALLVLERTQDSIKIIKHEEKVSLSANRLPYRLPHNLMIFDVSHMFSFKWLNNSGFPIIFPKQSCHFMGNTFSDGGGATGASGLEGTSFTNGGSIKGVKIVYPHCIIWFCIVFIKLS